MPGDDELPTIGQAISNWLGVQLPSVTLPQTLRNVDKAIAKLVLATGENLEARIKANTGKAKALGKINVDGLFRTDEEKRKLENRAAATKAALEDMEVNATTTDAPSEIDDDWLNFFARLSEDKSSEELQRLFGKILSGEIRKPGSFSLRTAQIMATISKQDAELLSNLLSYAVNQRVIPFNITVRENIKRPTDGERLFLEELGVAGHPSPIGGTSWNGTALPRCKTPLMASNSAILVDNKMEQSVEIVIGGQALTTVGRELLQIANPPTTDIESMKAFAKQIDIQLGEKYAAEMNGGLLVVHVASVKPIGGDNFIYKIIHTVMKDDH
jgi:hypothetical protein